MFSDKTINSITDMLSKRGLDNRSISLIEIFEILFDYMRSALSQITKCRYPPCNDVLSLNLYFKFPEISQ